MPRPAERPPRPISRQMALGFGAVSIVAVAMCVMLLGIINDVSGLVSGMRNDESSIRRGLELATAVREQSIHIAHSLLEADASHVAHYEQWRQQVQARIQQLAGVVPEAERWRLQVLSEKTQRLHDLFMSSALPAARLGDTAEARRVHREIEVLGQAAAEHSDALAKSVESQMAHAHVLATDATRLGLLAGGVCIILVVALSVGFTLRLRGAVLKPLVVLTDAARRFGRGEFEARVGEVGQGELAALGRTFNQMADELALRQTRLVQSERMAAIGQLAAGVAHELNNPIGIIRGYLKTMTPEDDPESLREELAIVDEEAAQCQRIAEDLLSYARAGELALDRIHASAFLEETARRLRESPAGQGRRILVETEDVDLEADGSRIRQVVLNLLMNAIQASPPDILDAPVTLRGMLDGDHYQIDVEDRGPGVAPADRQRVFEPFFSKRRGGSGLGLSVVLGIVKAHRGTIEVIEAPGAGAIFRVRLPLEQPALGSHQPAESS